MALIKYLLRTKLSLCEKGSRQAKLFREVLRNEGINDNDMNDRSFYNRMAIGKTFFEEIFKEITARTIHY